jgi:hypothetical protein
VHIRLVPLRRTLVQDLSVALPPAPDSPLGRVLASLIGLIGTTEADWPDRVSVGGGLNTGEVLRQLRIAAAWAGPVELDSYLAGNGTSHVTARLIGPTGRVELTLEAGGSGELIRAEMGLGG